MLERLILWLLDMLARLFASRKRYPIPCPTCRRGYLVRVVQVRNIDGSWPAPQRVCDNCREYTTLAKEAEDAG